MGKGPVEAPRKNVESKQERRKTANRLAQRKHREKRGKEWQRLLREIKETRTVCHKAMLAADAGDMELVRAHLSSITLPPPNTSYTAGPKLPIVMPCHVGNDPSTLLQPPERPVWEVGEIIREESHNSTQVVKPSDGAIGTAAVPPCSSPLEESCLPQSEGLDPVKELVRLDLAVCDLVLRIEKMDVMVRRLVDGQVGYPHGQTHRTGKAHRDTASRNARRKSLSRTCKQ
ncbi:hypothetical protein X797_012392 [Metarhizium robertsii]|uniref:BZIP domain-containing protein n=1 Tax=Metarhizium robertsii TaxID=568076 RepID=A0A014P019_9HYPO|nr:hypothetical protein X797_012392 [Metarhizium robertsii]